MISNLQLLRAFCALGVVYYHTGNTIFGMHTELGGVALFFCISGFIMAHIPQKSAAQFMTDRLIRVVPLYWIATLAFFFWTNSGMSNPTYVWPMLWGKLTEDPLFIPRWFLGNTGLTKDGAIQNLVMSLLFIPYKDHAGDMHPLLGVGWTLNLEMFFYCIYALSIAVRASIAPILACATMTIIWAAGHYGLLPGILAFYASDYVLYFAYGIVCHYVWQYLDTRVSWAITARIAIKTCAAAVFLAYLAAMTGTLKVESVWLNTICFAAATPPAVLVMVLLLHSSGFRPQFKFGLLLGNASYSLYLFHLFVMETIRPAGENWHWLSSSKDAIGASIAVALSVFLAIAAYRLIERPLTRALRDAAERRATAALAPA